MSSGTRFPVQYDASRTEGEQPATSDSVLTASVTQPAEQPPVSGHRYLAVWPSGHSRVCSEDELASLPDGASVQRITAVATQARPQRVIDAERK